MRIRPHFLFTLLFLSGIFIVPPLKGATESNVCQELDKIILVFTRQHYSPVTVNDKVKEEIIQLYLQEADPKGYFFYTEDVLKIKQIAVAKGLCEAFQFSSELYFKRVSTYDSLVKQYLKNPIGLKDKIQITIPARGKVIHQPAGKSYQQYIFNVLRFKFLGMVLDKSIEDSLSLNTITKLTPPIEKEVRNNLLNLEETYLRRLIQDKSKTIASLEELFLNAVTNRYDPHSNYFSGAAKEEFEAGLSEEVLSFGLYYDENDDFEIQVAGIQPGSSAWNSGQIHEEDILEKIELSNGTVYELIYEGTSFVDKIIDDVKNTELTFHFRRSNNEIYSVKLIKTKVDNVENSFSGYVLKDKEIHIGYIPLPSFYTDTENDQMLGCANDIAREILLMKNENLSGLIIDLRDNGGGSLKEAMDIAGLFINEGALGVYKYKDEKPILLKDMNRGTVYDGPLMIMVNGISASASEFLSGCLQDYGRAVITGSPTFGKGTAQEVIPLDSLKAMINPLTSSYVKITNGKFYHVSRRSNQVKGIIPDFSVPSVYDQLSFFKESHYPYALPNDSVIKNVKYTASPKLYNETDLGLSKKRIEENKRFKSIRSLADSLKLLFESDQVVPLDFDGYMKYMNKIEKLYDHLYKVYDENTEVISVENHTHTSQLLLLKPIEAEFNKQIRMELKNDPEIIESFLIFKDIIK